MEKCTDPVLESFDEGVVLGVLLLEQLQVKLLPVQQVLLALLVLPEQLFGLVVLFLQHDELALRLLQHVLVGGHLLFGRLQAALHLAQPLRRLLQTLGHLLAALPLLLRQLQRNRAKKLIEIRSFQWPGFCFGTVFGQLEFHGYVCSRYVLRDVLIFLAE